MFNSTFSMNNIVSFFSEDRMYERWNRREIEELMYDNLEWEHNPFQESDIDSIPNAYWGWEEHSPFYEEDVEEIPDLPCKWNFLYL